MPKRKRRAQPAAAQEARERGVSKRRPDRVPPALDRLMQTFLLLTVFLIPIAMDPRARSWIEVKGMLMIWLAAAMLLVWIMSALRQGRFTWRRSPLNPAVLAMVGSAVISIIPSRYWWMGIVPLAELAAFAVFYFCAINWAVDRARVERLLWAAAGGILVVGIYGACQRYGVDFMVYPESEMVTDRILSSQGNATFLAGYLIVLLPLLGLLALGLHRQSAGGDVSSGAAGAGFARFLRVAAMVLFLLAEACLIWTWTRAAFVGFLTAGALLIALLTWAFVSRRRAIRWRFDYWQPCFIGAAAVLGAVLVLLQPAYERDIVKRTASALAIAVAKGSTQPVRAEIDSAPRSEAPGQEVVVGSDAMATEVQYGQRRRHMWEAAFQTFKQHPITGSGLGTYQIYMRSHPWSAAKHERTPQIVGALHAHNEYLEILSDQGAFGLVAFLWLLGAYGVTAFRVLRRGGAFWWAVAAGMLAGVVGLLIQNIFAISFRQIGVVLYFWLALSLTATAGVAIGEGTPAQRSLRLPMVRGGGAVVAGIVSLGLLGVLAYVLLIPLRAERYMFLAANAIEHKQIEFAARMLEKQKELTPRRPEPWAMLGPLYGMIGEEAPSADMRRTYYEKSLQALKQADKLCPNYRNVRRNIAAAYSHLGKPREAIRALREAAKVQDASWLYADMARNHVALGEFPQAEVTARKAVQYEPTNAEYHHLLAHALSSELKKEEALEEYRAAAHLNPAEAKYYVGMGYAYAYLGKRREAVEALRKALNLAVPGSNEEKLAQQGLRVLGQ